MYNRLLVTFFGIDKKMLDQTKACWRAELKILPIDFPTLLFNKKKVGKFVLFWKNRAGLKMLNCIFPRRKLINYLSRINRILFFVYLINIKNWLILGLRWNQYFRDSVKIIFFRTKNSPKQSSQRQNSPGKFFRA